MDYVLDTARVDVVAELRREVSDYLRRHAEEGSDIDGATLALSELVTNAVEHGGGDRAWVHVDWSGPQPLVEIHDLGTGFDLEPALPGPASPGGRGIYIAAHLTSELRVASKSAGGTKVAAVMPVFRPAEKSHDPPRRSPASLPTPEEASPDGTFGRESFLRALVVQLGQSVEAQEGPDAVEHLVAQVGADVGGRMEEEYRRAREITGKLSPDQIGDLYVRLKAAIDGDFYVIEANEEKIVLGNRACPFGDMVKRAPGLCRMTSSVFGGIAARNRDEATVVLEERIAVGDPGCRVVVWLGEPPRDSHHAGHRYRAPR